MPIPLGILAAAGFRPAAGGSYELIETITVGSGGAASVTFSNLNTYSTTYQHLQIRGVVRTTRSGPSTGDILITRFNGISTSTYDSHVLAGTGSNVVSAADNNISGMFTTYVSGSANTANVYSALVMDILDPYEAKNKTVRQFFAGLTSDDRKLGLQSGLWRSTSSVSSITISCLASLDNGSRFSIYGLKAS